MKSYTDIEQSNELAEILPIESADMWYSYYGNPKYNPTIAYEGEQWFLCHIRNSSYVDIPCWSLAALFNVLPSATLDSSSDHYFRIHCIERYTEWHDNAVDACVAMIEKLHNLKMLKL